MSKSKSDDPGKTEKIPNHNWQKTIVTKKSYVCEICKEAIEVGASAKYRVKEDNIVVHAHVECVKKGKNLITPSQKEREAAILGVTEETCGECPKKDSCNEDCAILEEAITEIGQVA